MKFQTGEIPTGTTVSKSHKELVDLIEIMKKDHETLVDQITIMKN